MATELELHSLVDLALRNPDVGVVNFNHLHQLLHAILNHIGIGRGVKVEFLAKLPATETAQPPILAPPEENGLTAAINKDATTAKETERLTHEETAKDGACREGIERRQFPNRDEIRRLVLLCLLFTANKRLLWFGFEISKLNIWSNCRIPRHFRNFDLFFC